MINKKTFLNLVSVIFSSGVLLLSGIITNLVVPKIMGVTNYGYYKIFILYSTYVALCHFGVVDGVLLKYGGKKVSINDLISIRSYFRFLLYYSIMFSVILCFIANSFNGAIRWIIFFLGIQITISNLFYYLQYLTQALMEFKTFSFFNILQASINIVIVLILFILDRLSYLSNLSYKIYIPLYLLTYLIVLIGYVDKLKQYVFGKVKAIFKIRYDILGLIKLGLPVTISYQVATLIFNIDNQFISMFFSTITFGLYSFAYSMVSLVTTILNTTSTVLFPTLNGRTMNKNIAIYNKLIMLLLILVYLMVIVYYPVELIVKNFLPEYVNSLIYFKIVIPGVGISSSISLIIFNFFKALKKGHIYFIYGCFILVFAVVVNTAVYFITHSAISIAIASLIILFTWYLITNRYLATKYGIIYKKNTFYLVIMTLVFEVYVIGIRSIFISILFYFISYCIITLLFYRKELLRICKRVF